MNLKSRFVGPIRSRYAFATNHFEVEIVSGNEGSYFVSRHRGRGIPKKSEFFFIFLLKAIRSQKAAGENIWVIDNLHSLKLKVVWTVAIVGNNIDTMFSKPDNLGEFLFWASQPTTWKIEKDSTNDISYSSK